MNRVDVPPPSRKDSLTAKSGLIGSAEVPAKYFRENKIVHCSELPWYRMESSFHNRARTPFCSVLCLAELKYSFVGIQAMLFKLVQLLQVCRAHLSSIDFHPTIEHESVGS